MELLQALAQASVENDTSDEERWDPEQHASHGLGVGEKSEQGHRGIERSKYGERREGDEKKRALRPAGARDRCTKERQRTLAVSHATPPHCEVRKRLGSTASSGGPGDGANAFSCCGFFQDAFFRRTRAGCAMHRENL
jgi:hypothetical protein